MKINQKVSFQEYRSWPGINASSLGYKTPLHYLHDRENPKDSKAMKIGRAFHELVLEPDEFDKNYAIAPRVDKRTKVGKEEYAEWLKNSDGKEVLDYLEHRQILDMAINFDKHPTAKQLIVGKREISTQFSLDGILCKARADCLLMGDFLVDLKTTRDASPEGFIKSVYNFGYYRQAAFYLEAFKRTEFIFIAVESEPPYAIGLYQVPKEMIEYGLIEAKIKVKELHQCMKSNYYPGYPEKIEMIEAPGWMLHKLEQFKDSEGDIYEH